jgi:hypothetical protein
MSESFVFFHSLEEILFHELDKERLSYLIHRNFPVLKTK